MISPALLIDQFMVVERSLVLVIELNASRNVRNRLIIGSAIDYCYYYHYTHLHEQR